MKTLVLHLACISIFGGMIYLIWWRLQQQIQMIPEKLYEHDYFLIKISHGQEINTEIQIDGKVFYKNFDVSPFVPRVGENIFICLDKGASLVPYSLDFDIGKLGDDYIFPQKIWTNGNIRLKQEEFLKQSGLSFRIISIQNELLDSSFYWPTTRLKLILYPIHNYDIESLKKNGWKKKTEKDFVEKLLDR